MRASLLVAAALSSAWAALAYSDLEDSFPSEFGMQMLYSRVVATKAVPPFFHNALGGASAPAITDSGNPARPYEVDGSTFIDFRTAADRACDNQHNACQKLANKQGATFSVTQCDQQQSQCKVAAGTASNTAFSSMPGTSTGATNPTPTNSGQPVLFSSNAQFDFFCDP